VYLTIFPVKKAGLLLPAVHGHARITVDQAITDRGIGRINHANGTCVVPQWSLGESQKWRVKTIDLNILSRSTAVSYTYCSSRDQLRISKIHALMALVWFGVHG